MAGRQVVGEGKTVDEAIENALQQLQATKNQVIIEVLQEPTRRLFGRRKSNLAKVRLTVKEHPTTSTALDLVSVENGELKYNSPGPDGIPPTIHFSSDLRVLYHGNPVEKHVVLSEGLDPLEIVLPINQQPELQYEVVINPTRTRAQLFWKRLPGVIYQLEDKPPTNQLHLSVKKTIVEAPALSLQEVQQIVRAEGLKFGLRLQELSPEMFKAPEGVCDLAVGVEPGETRQPTIKYVFQEEAAAIDLEAIRIDHYEVHGISGVEEGAVLAIKDPGEPGNPGVDVYGESIEPTPIQDVAIQVGEGAALTDDGLKAVATVAGLPSLQKGVVRVTQVFELLGDADVSTGNITMDGDIIIRGNVLENVKVETQQGTVTVNGLVSGAIVRAGKSINVARNVVRSQLYAGGFSVNQIRILSMLESIAEQLEGLLVAYDSIVSQAEHVSFESLIKHLLELKFFRLPKLVQELLGFLEEIKEKNNHGLFALEDTLHRFLPQPNSLAVTDRDELLEFRRSIEESIRAFESLRTTESNVKVGYLQNTRVEASGAVEVTGQGCFYSTVLAGTAFKIPNGVFRGGEVIVDKGDVVAKELGGPTGIATKVQLLREGSITANLVHPNVQVVIGLQAYKFDDTTSQVKAFLRENMLTVYSGSNKIHG